MGLGTTLRQIADFFRVARFQAGAWPLRALPGVSRARAGAAPAPPVPADLPPVPARRRAPPARRARRPPPGAEVVRETLVDLRRRPGFAPWAWLIGISAGLLLIAWIEIRTAVIESWLFTTLSSSLTYDVRPGAASVIIFPRGGPADLERGYARIPDFARRLDQRGFRVAEQARFSRTLALASRLGFTPPYAERPAVGLVIRGAGNEVVYDATPRERVFAHLDELPPVVEQSLLFIEDRELGRPDDAYTNPAVDWNRLAKAALTYTSSRLGLGGTPEGGSTLAVQMQKYRHSESGRTEHPLEKLRQMGSASLRAYHTGPDTRLARRRIVLDYLNTVPLAAYPGFGEVHGLKDGLRLWFGRDPEEVLHDLAQAEPTAAKARAFQQTFALLCAVRAPSHYLIRDRKALEARIDSYTHLLAAEGIIDAELARRVRATPLEFGKRKVAPPRVDFAERKATDLARRQLARLLGTSDFYVLDRLDLQVETTIDEDLQRDIEALFRKLKSPEFVDAQGLRAERLLATGDPRSVVYSFALFEKTPHGDLVRVHADNLNRPFDVNHGMKMELGSTAKLRTLAHYVDVMATLHDELAAAPIDSLRRLARAPTDPLTGWAAATLVRHPAMVVDTFLHRSLLREYSADPGEMFWTGGGIHYFSNFDKKDNGKVLTLREATAHSTNLVFIRLMRDLVRYHTARLPYDARGVIDDPAHPDRRRLLDRAARNEAEVFLARAFQKYRDVKPADIPARLLEGRARSARHLAILFFGWNPEADSAALARWLAPRATARPEEIGRWARQYARLAYGLQDYGYLLDRHPLELWTAGQRHRDPDLGWEELLRRSDDAVRSSMAWLYQTRNKDAQDLRLRVLIEKDAFARMEPSWKKLGFPFERLVPSYATSIGSSADRPDALATLMGIIVDDGVKRPPQLLERLRFGSGTPYHTVFDSPTRSGERVLPAAVARALRDVLADVVDHGTAVRVKRAFTDSTGATLVVVGGKTGSGDNRLKSVGKGGGVISSRATSRTAAFTFFIGDRYYGVITTSVMGPKAEQYSFTSALPLEVLKMAAPAILDRIAPERHEQALARLEPPAETAPAPRPAAAPRGRPADAEDGDEAPERDEPVAPRRPAVQGPEPRPADPVQGPEPRPTDVRRPDAERAPAPGAKPRAPRLKGGEPPAPPAAPPVKIKRLKKPEHTAPARDTTRRWQGPKEYDASATI